MKCCFWHKRAAFQRLSLGPRSSGSRLLANDEVTTIFISLFSFFPGLKLKDVARSEPTSDGTNGLLVKLHPIFLVSELSVSQKLAILELNTFDICLVFLFFWKIWLSLAKRSLTTKWTIEGTQKC